MTEQQRVQLVELEGCRVSVALADGSRLDDCPLVSVGRQPVDSVWLFVNGADVFIPLRDIVDLWEPPFRSTARAR